MREKVGTGRCNRDPGAPDKRKRHRVSRHADADQRPAGGHRIGNRCRATQQKRERSRPKGFHQAPRSFRDVEDEPVEHDFVRNVNDDRVPRGPLLGHKDLRHCGGIQRIRSKPVHGFSGQCDQAAIAQNLRCAVERLRSRGAL